MWDFYWLKKEKAFDTENHSILLLKLHHYRVRSKAYEWLQSYLSNRKKFVCLKGHDSDSLPLTCGVRQGSVLGPLLFLWYVNDSPNTSSLLTFHLFADDINMYYSCENLYDLESKLNRVKNSCRIIDENQQVSTKYFKNKFHWFLFHSRKLKLSNYLI